MITVLAFARYRSLLGFEQMKMELPRPGTVQGLLAGPRFSNLPTDALVAVNQAFVKRSAALQDEDQVALLPPVSGG